MTELEKTDTHKYASYLFKADNSLWKKIFFAQAPYYLNIKYMRLKRTLDIGCGTGRNLARLTNSIGVDHNSFCIDICKKKGLSAFSSHDFHSNAEHHKSSFDTLLLSHVIEHMTYSDSISLILEYMPYLKSESRIVIITPQALGYRSDPTHITYFDQPLIENLLLDAGVQPEKFRSFPLPSYFGSVFRHNELISIGKIRPETSKDNVQ